VRKTAVAILVIVVGAVAGLGGLAATTSYGKSQATYKVTLLQGVRGDEFYISMACGAKAAAAKLGNVKLDVQGPAKFDASLQIPILNAISARKPNVIMMAPTDTKALIAPMKQAKSRGIKIIEVDTHVTDASISISKIASNNTKGGRDAAIALARLTGSKGEWLVMNVKPGISTTDQRQKGFELQIKKYPNVKYLGTRFDDDDPAKAASLTSAELAAHPKMNGIFGANLFSAEGAATGVRNARKQNQVKIVGFDAGPAQVQQLKQGLTQALVAQKPYDIGFQAVVQAVNAMTGKKVTPKIQTGLVIVTKSNIGQPGVAKYLYKAKC
jgi:ribose transport system substrate-binding protein